MTKTILLTGGSGYLGRRLTAALEEKGYHTVCLRRQQAQTPQQIDAAFAQGPVFAVIHLATCYGRSGETFPTVIESNLRYPAEVLAAAVKHRVPVFINTDTILARFINPYALSKAQFAEWLRLYCGQITAVNMRLDHFYGPFDTPNKFVAFLLKSFRENRPVLELTEGAQTRDFIYIDDVVRAFLCVLEQAEKFPRGLVHAFEVGTNVKTSIKDLVLLAQKLCGNTQTRLLFGAVPYRAQEQLDYEIDTSALQALGWKAQVPLEEGLKRILEEEGK